MCIEEDVDAVYQRKKGLLFWYHCQNMWLMMACSLSLNSWEYWEAKLSVLFFYVLMNVATKRMFK